MKGGRLYPSSMTCSACGGVYRDLAIADRSWTCPSCGAHHDRDLNATANITDEGARILASMEDTARNAEPGR